MQWIAPILLLSLVSCATTPSEVVRACPVIRAYTAAQQDQAADELDRLGYPSTLAQFMADYADLRQQVRDCKGGK